MATIKEVDLLIDAGSGYRSVDITRSSAFSFNLQMSEIVNPTATNIPFSVQIKLPRTQANNDVFEHIYRLDHVTRGFDPIARAGFLLYVNGSIFQEGYMKLESVNKAEYMVRLYGSLGDFFYSINEVSGSRDMRLKSLSFPLLNHVINGNALGFSWGESSAAQANNQSYWDNASGAEVREFVFTYAMSYQGAYENFDSDSEPGKIEKDGEEVDAIVDTKWVKRDGTSKFKNPELTEHRRNWKDPDSGQVFCGEYRSYYQRPAIKIKFILNAIIEKIKSTGWRVNLDTDFFNDQNPYWSKLWMIFPPYDTENDDDIANNIYVGKNDGTNWFGQVYLSDSNGAGSLSEPIPCGEKVIDTNESYRVSGKISFMMYADYDGTPPSHEYATLNPYGNGTVSVDIVVNNKVVVNSQIKITGLSSEYILIYPDNDVNFYYRKLEEKEASVFTLEFFSVFSSAGFPAGSKVSVRSTLSGNTRWATWYGRVYPYGVSMVVLPDSYLNVSPSKTSSIRSGSIVGYESMVRSEETCFDFLMSYGKLFGLHYIKGNGKTVDIVTRNTMYGAMDKLDWTKKIDYSKDFVQYPIPFDYRSGIFKWKESGTKLESDYKERTGKQYGSLTFDTGYSFNSEKKEYLEGIMFANGITATDFSQYYLGRDDVMYKDNKELPYFQSDDVTGISDGYALFFYDGRGDVPYGSGNFRLTDDDNMMTDGPCWSSSEGSTMSWYPLFRRVIKAGEAFSLNFGRPSMAYTDSEKEYIGDDTAGDETLYARFWKAYINDRFSRNNKVLDCYVLLRQEDVTSDIFRKFIFIENTVWVVDKIHNFNPMTKGSTKVTLVKVQDMENYANGQNIGEASEETVPVITSMDVQYFK